MIVCYHQANLSAKEVIDYDRNEENGFEQLHNANDYLGEQQIRDVHASWYHFGTTIFLCL